MRTGLDGVEDPNTSVVVRFGGLVSFKHGFCFIGEP